MAKTGDIPYSWAEIEAEIRLVLAAQANLIAHYGRQPGALTTAAQFLGLDGELEVFNPREIADLPFKTDDFHLHYLVRQAYLYAYQLEGAENTDPIVWDEIPGILEGLPQADAMGEPTPLYSRIDAPLRRVLDTFFARWDLFENSANMSIRELSLLANMTVPAVRTALSKAGYSVTHQGSIGLPNDLARKWLSERRSFLPQSRPLIYAMPQAIYDRDLPFLDKLALIDGTYPVNEDAPLRQWLDTLLAGEKVAPDPEQLRALARRWDLIEGEFAADFMRHLMTLD